MADRTKDLMRYPLDTFQLIPLHKPKATKTYPNGKVVQVGKAPLHAKWTTRKYDSKAVRDDCIDQKRNAGVRLTDRLLVVDIDPRNGGDVGFLALCSDIGLDPDAFPTVITGSGGRHLYMRKPPEVLVRDTLESEDYNGVEFKSKGRQVVAAGSLHPNGKPYRWDDTKPKIEDGLPMAPKALLNIIKRPPRSAVAGGGQYSPAQIAEILEGLDVAKYDTNDKWLQLMMACHHASAGEARSEFLEWSAQDPDFAKLSYTNGKRWDSLHAEKNDGITFRTLNMILRNSGHASKQVVVVPDDEFPDDDAGAAAAFDAMPITKPKEKKTKAAALDKWLHSDDDDDEDEEVEFNIDDDGVTLEGYDEKARSRLSELNKNHVALLEAGKFKIMYQSEDPDIQHRMVWQTCDRSSFESMHCNVRLERDNAAVGMSRNASNTIRLGQAWMEWSGRRSVKGVLFEPDSSKGDRDGYLNLWTGFGYSPEKGKGSWKWMQDLMFEVMAAGDQKIYDYIMNWLALMFQQPGTVPGTALVFNGGQGLGKGTFGNMIVKLVGAHAIAIGDPDQLTGRFNAHMRNLIFLFADEITAAYGNKAAEAKLRHIITEPYIQVEKKGVDLIRCRNLLHMMIATNSKWVVGAGRDERRYLVNTVADVWHKTDKFTKLRAELSANNDAGFKRMLWDLMQHPIPDDWDAMRCLPNTHALTEQKIMSMSPITRYWYNILTEKALPFSVVAGDWATEPVKLFLQDFRDGFNAWAKTNDMKGGANGRSTHSQLMAEIKDLFGSAKINQRYELSEDAAILNGGIDGRGLGIELPPINVCFREFETACGLPAMSLGEHLPWG